MKDKDNGSNPVQKMMPKVEHMASAVMEKVSEFGESVSDTANTVMGRVSEFGGTVSDRANAAVTSVGGSMKGLAGTLREKSPDVVAPYAERAAVGLEQAGAYLKKESIGEILDDFVSLVQRHPVPLLMFGIGLGYMLSRRRKG